MVMRIGGLASGIDTDTTVKQMLAREQTRIDKVKGQKQTLQWQQEIYRETIGAVNKFKSKYFDVLNRGSYALSNNFFSSKTSKIVGTDNGIINIKPTNTANPGRYEVEVKAQATGAKAEGNLPAGSKLTDKILVAGDKLNIKVGNDKEVNITVDKDTTISDLISKINSDSSLKGKVNASFSEITGKFSIETIETGSSQKLEISGNAATKIGLSVKATDTVTLSPTKINEITPTLISGEIKDKDGNIATEATTLENLGFTNNDVKFKVNGKEVLLTKDKTLGNLITEINTAGAGVTASMDTKGKITIKGALADEGKETSFSLTVEDTDEDRATIKMLGFSSSIVTEVKSASVKTSERYDLVFSQVPNGKSNVEINGKAVEIDTTGFDINNPDFTTLNLQLSSKGVTGIEFHIKDGKLGLTSKSSFSFSGTNASLASLGFVARAKTQDGQDAEISVKVPGETSGTTVTNSKNNFTIDGINFDIKGVTPKDTPISFNIESDVDKAVDNVKGIIDAYNELIDSIGSTIYQRKQYKYEPLTEEQKKDMSESEIKAWEEKCKQGILRNDPAMEKFLTDMRQAFFAPVEGVNIRLRDIGIDTSSDYSQRGKLVINEEKLRKALTEKPDDVTSLFIKDDSTKPYDRDKGYSGNTKRRDSVGIFTRMTDIIEDSIRTGTNKNGIRGSFLEKAGMKGTTSETKNRITEQIKDKEDMLSELIRKMEDKETRLYNQFSTLETMMNKYNSQSSWLTQQLGGA